jgi:hypothetical protein
MLHNLRRSQESQESNQSITADLGGVPVAELSCELRTCEKTFHKLLKVGGSGATVKLDLQPTPACPPISAACTTTVSDTSDKEEDA